MLPKGLLLGYIPVPMRPYPDPLADAHTQEQFQKCNKLVWNNPRPGQDTFWIRTNFAPPSLKDRQNHKAYQRLARHDSPTSSGGGQPLVVAPLVFNIITN